MAAAAAAAGSSRLPAVTTQAALAEEVDPTRVRKTDIRQINTKTGRHTHIQTHTHTFRHIQTERHQNEHLENGRGHEGGFGADERGVGGEVAVMVVLVGGGHGGFDCAEMRRR